MQIISNIALISINETLFVQLISFLIFLFLINHILFRPLRDQMGKREEHIETIKQDIEENKNELEAITNRIKEQEIAARKEAIMMRDKLEKEGSVQASEIIKSARKKIISIREKAESEVNAQIVQARKNIKKEAAGIALNMMEKVLDRRLNL